MNRKNLRKFYVFSLIGVILASFYPIYMGVRVVGVRFGSGFFFDGLGGIVLAPVDLLIILISGGITVLIMAFHFRK